MRILIKGTNISEDLEMIDPRTGVNYVLDFIGNAGGLGSSFIYDDDECVYVCDQDNYEWWNKVIADNQALEDRIYRLSKEHRDVYDVVNNASTNDLEDHAEYVNQALDEAYGEDA